MFNIVNWSEKFETADTRKRQRLGWFLAPSGNDSKGYRKLMRQGKDGVIAYGVFMALCQYMATLSKESRGSFVNSDGTEMDFDDLSEVTRIEVADIRHATGTLVACGWLTPIGTTICQSSASHLPPICQSSPSFVKEEGEEQGQGQGEVSSPLSQSDDQKLLKAVWSIFPEVGRRRSSKKQVATEWKKIKKTDRPTQEAIVESLKGWIACPEWQRDNCQAVQGVHLWIKNERWDSTPQQFSTPQHQVTEFIGNE